MSISTAQQIIEARAPQYIGDARLSDFIALATLRVGAAFAEVKQYAIALRVLHMLAIADRGSVVTGAGGAVSREKEGQLERAYGGSSAASIDEGRYPDLSQTSWGRELIALQNENILGPRNRTI